MLFKSVILILRKEGGRKFYSKLEKIVEEVIFGYVLRRFIEIFLKNLCRKDSFCKGNYK